LLSGLVSAHRFRAVFGGGAPGRGIYRPAHRKMMNMNIHKIYNELKELKMKKTLIVLSCILMACFYTFAETKIGIINGQRLIEGTKRGRALAEKMEAIGKDKQAKLNAMQDEIKKLEKDLMSPALNEDTKEKKSLELQNKTTAAKRFIEDSQREMQIKTEQEMNTLKTEIQPIIQQVGKEKGLTIILEITAVAYFDPAADITDDIIRIMDSKATGAK
jgi:outer membrane protein